MEANQGGGGPQEKTTGIYHEVDGIIELDNPSPTWWQTLFYLLIIWSIGYGGYYLVGGGPTLKEELAQDLARIEMTKVAKNVSADDEGKELRSVFKSPERLAQGKLVFVKNCASCHAADGGGTIGPNLADMSWIHGDGSIDAILKVIRDGVADKGMPPWGPILKHEEALEVAAFVRSLRGTSPAKPKPAQGSPVDGKADI